MFPRKFYKTITVRSNLFRLSSCRTNHSSTGKTSNEADNSSLEKKPNEISRLLEDAVNYNPADDSGWATTAYPKSVITKSQDEHPEKQRINPADTSVILFPGQGVLKVGDVKEYLRFPDAKYLFQIANEALGYDLLKICLTGPQDVLDRTEYNQPATVVTSLAAIEKLREERPRAIETCNSVAGYSVGEITALIFSGAINFEAGVRLVGIRATAMQDAADMVPQGMLFTHCRPEAKISDICKKAENWAMDAGVETPECRVAIYLHPYGKILAGSEEALKYLEANGKELGLRRIKRLPVSGAFHTSLMKPALSIFTKALRTVEIEDPRVSVHSNVDGKRYKNAMHIANYLPKQIVSPVKWEQTMHMLYRRTAGVAFPRTFDVGSRGVLKAFLKECNAKASDSCYTI